MTWLHACPLDAVPESGALAVEVSGIPMAIVRTEGEVFAIKDVCSHADVALSEGDVEGCFIECWLHGSKFDLRTGEPTSLPAITPVPVYPVRIEGSGASAEVHVDVETL